MTFKLQYYYVNHMQVHVLQNQPAMQHPAQVVQHQTAEQRAQQNALVDAMNELERLQKLSEQNQQQLGSMFV